MSNENDNSEPSKNGEVIPPDDSSGGSSRSDSGTAIYADIIANISHYTERPDLLLEVLEKHDPGFIKRMNNAADVAASEQRAARFKFGEHQAYTALYVSIGAAVAVLLALFALILTEQASLWSILGLGILYAITQGGSKGFLAIIDGLKQILWNRRSPRRTDDTPD